MILGAGIRWSHRISFCVLLIFPLKCLYCFKINSPSVLLAYNKGLPSNYTLDITGTNTNECFQWQSANPQIVHVTPVFSLGEHLLPNCSKKAILSSVANLLERRVTQISATLLGGNGKTLYCDAITDSVSSIELQYVTDKLVLDGQPQKLKVIAKDKDGQTFTSINGLEVHWKVAHHLDQFVEQSEEHRVIRLSRFDVSEYESPDKENEFERRGLLSGTILVEPLQLGTSVISASLLLSSVPVLQTQDISLKVVPNLKIYPSSPLYLVRLASLNVKIEKLNSKEEENLENFTANNEDSSVVILTNLSHLSANEYGFSTITYTNKNYPEVALEVNVVKLARIGFRISGGGYKTLQEMKIYEVFLDLYDENGNEIYGTDNLRFSVSFPTKLFHIVHTSANGTYSVVQSIAPGSGKIRAEFKGIFLKDESISKEYTVSGFTDVTVCQKLSIFPPHTLLPVSKEIPMQIIPLTVTGGTGHYVWALSNYTAAKVVTDMEKKNAIKLEVYDEVDLIVTVTDTNNVNFISTAKVSIQTPLEIEAYPTVTEAEVGNVLIVPTALLGYENREKDIIRKFDDCSKADIKVDIIEKYVLIYEKEADIPSFGKGCMSLQFRCKMAGHSRVNMEYTLISNENASSTSAKTFKTTTMLACYKPIKPVYPVRVAVLALGTSMEVAFEGGPRKWPLFKEGHYSELEPNNPDILKIELIKDPVRYNKDLSVFRVTCKALGDNTLTLKIGNRPSATIQHPAKSEASIKLICTEPHSLHLKLFKKKSLKELKDENIVKVPFYGEKVFSVDIFVKDSLGRKFANISSLRVAWDVSDNALAHPVSNFDFVTHENAVAGYRKLSRSFIDFKMRGPAGALTVKAKITSYRKEILSKEGVTDYKEIGEISNTIDLKLVSLRDINAGLYDAAKEQKEENGYCENDSCKS